MTFLSRDKVDSHVDFFDDSLVTASKCKNVTHFEVVFGL